MLLKWDGHTHTNFCNHGSDASMDMYVEQAIRLGFERYTLSEHSPLPSQFLDDPLLMKMLAMEEEQLSQYFEQAIKVKQQYEGNIEIPVGLEMDYLYKKTDYTLRLIDQWEDQLEDIVLSVHYLPGMGGMQCMDYTPELFQSKLIDYYGSMDKVVDEYYNHIEQAIELAAGIPVRTRIGHMNLIEKFRLALPEIDPSQMMRRLNGILPKLEAAGVGIDVNTAGFRKTTCQQAYVPEWFMGECIRRNIPLVYGSDSHHPQDVGSGWDWFQEKMTGLLQQA